MVTFHSHRTNKTLSYDVHGTKVHLVFTMLGPPDRVLVNQVRWNIKAHNYFFCIIRSVCVLIVVFEFGVYGYLFMQSTLHTLHHDLEIHVLLHENRQLCGAADADLFKYTCCSRSTSADRRSVWPQCRYILCRYITNTQEGERKKITLRCRRSSFLCCEF